MELKNDFNEFMSLRKSVRETVSQYEEARKKAFPNLGKYADKYSSIKELAKPFLTGYFTIAVAGKMSAGKSTFINSLIGENLLPTGHFQTTSGITWIVSSDKRFMEVLYADGHKQIFEQNLAEELRKWVAVPEKFDKLPISDINNLIIGNNSIDLILKKKAGIEKKTGTSADDSLWREYVESTPKRKIAEKVVIYLQLPKEYEGWRIVDTPGVGAIGGIQEATLSLLTSREENSKSQQLVDAVILLHKGTENIQDESVNKFAEEISKSMGNLAHGRLFFVLTNASSAEFLNNKDGILTRAYNLFGKRLSIPEERITYVDSLINRFLTDAKKSGKDFSNFQAFSNPLDNWNESDWKNVTNLLYQIMGQLCASGKEVTNSTLFKALEESSRFNILREKLNEFLNNEKQKTFEKLMEMIEEELNANEFRLQQEIKAVSNGPEGINKQIKEIEDEHHQLENILVKLQQKTTRGTIKKCFSFVDEELEALSSKSTIQEVRAAYLKTRNKGLSAEENYFKALINDFSEFAKDFENTNLKIGSMDLEAIEREAKRMATKKVTDYSRSEEKLVKKGGVSSKDQYEKIYPYTKDEVDFERKLREFIYIVKKEGREHNQAFIEGNVAKASFFFTKAKQSIEERKSLYIARLEKLRNNKYKAITELKIQLNVVQEVKKEINKYVD